MKAVICKKFAPVSELVWEEVADPVAGAHLAGCCCIAFTICSTMLWLQRSTMLLLKACWPSGHDKL